MGSVTVSAASGHGSQSLGGTVSVTTLAAILVTAGPLAHIDGATPTRRLHQIGWYGVGFDPSTGLSTVTFGKFVEYENEGLVAPVGALGPADTLWWDLTPGTVCTLYAAW